MTLKTSEHRIHIKNNSPFAPPFPFTSPSSPHFPFPYPSDLPVTTHDLALEGKVTAKHIYENGRLEGMEGMEGRKEGRKKGRKEGREGRKEGKQCYIYLTQHPYHHPLTLLPLPGNTQHPSLPPFQSYITSGNIVQSLEIHNTQQDKRTIANLSHNSA